MNAEHGDIIETLVDKIGASGVLDVLAVVCWSKAQHIEENWQDKETAKTWGRDANKVYSLSCKVNN